jgi:hypothetical protein
MSPPPLPKNKNPAAALRGYSRVFLALVRFAYMSVRKGRALPYALRAVRAAALFFFLPTAPVFRSRLFERRQVRPSDVLRNFFAASRFL